MTPPPKPQLDLTWQDHSHCNPDNAHLFFIPLAAKGGRPKTASYDAARAICRDCPVQPQCLEHALTRPEKFGFWGGYDPDELRKMRGERIHQRAETAA